MEVRWHGVALFWSAGALNWWPARAALAVIALWTAAIALIVFRTHPALLAERLEPRNCERRWDSAIVGLMGLVTLVRHILAGLDQRYGWTGGLPVGVQLAALALCVVGNDVLTEPPGYREYAQPTLYRLTPGQW